MTNLHLIKLKKPLKLEIHSNFHQNKTCSKSRHNLQDYILPFTHVPMLVFLVLKNEIYSRFIINTGSQ